jgi:NAD+ synthase (glutamine-hydrolysing)
MFNEYMRKSGLSGCVVSVSGGVDSAVTYALCLAAMKQANSPVKKVLGVAQPIKSTKSIMDRAYELRALGGEIVTVDQTALHGQLQALVDGAVGIKGEGFASGQLRSYMRTPVGYYCAQLLSQAGTPAVVMGTGNMDEDGYLLYYCKAGDGVVDIQLIADLHKSEVFSVGRHLHVPESILVAPPSADLWDGHTDEGELGFSYDFVELYQSYRNMPEADKAAFRARLDKAGLDEFDQCHAMADKVHNRNKHKEGGPKNLNVLNSLLF